MRTDAYTVTTPFQRDLLDYYLRHLIQDYLRISKSVSESSHHNVVSDVIVLREQHQEMMQAEAYPFVINLAYSLKPDLIMALVNKSDIGAKWARSSNPGIRMVGERELKEAEALSALVSSVPERVWVEDPHADEAL